MPDPQVALYFTYERGTETPLYQLATKVKRIYWFICPFCERWSPGLQVPLSSIELASPAIRKNSVANFSRKTPGYHALPYIRSAGKWLTTPLHKPWRKSEVELGISRLQTFKNRPLFKQASSSSNTAVSRELELALLTIANLNQTFFYR